MSVYQVIFLEPAKSSTCGTSLVSRHYCRTCAKNLTRLPTLPLHAGLTPLSTLDREIEADILMWALVACSTYSVYSHRVAAEIRPRGRSRESSPAYRNEYRWSCPSLNCEPRTRSRPLPGRSIAVISVVDHFRISLSLELCPELSIFVHFGRLETSDRGVEDDPNFGLNW